MAAFSQQVVQCNRENNSAGGDEKLIKFVWPLLEYLQVKVNFYHYGSKITIFLFILAMDCCLFAT